MIMKQLKNNAKKSWQIKINKRTIVILIKINLSQVIENR